MRNPYRLNNFYNEICYLHMENCPDWRFGQFILNFCKWFSDTHGGQDIFYLEENTCINYIKEFIQEVVKNA